MVLCGEHLHHPDGENITIGGCIKKRDHKGLHRAETVFGFVEWDRMCRNEYDDNDDDNYGFSAYCILTKHHEGRHEYKNTARNLVVQWDQ
jgi:hypothetical protein